MAAIKYVDWTVSEIPLKDIVDTDTYQWFPISRTYASGCVFLDQNLEKVFLVTTEKDEKIVHQFTWWSPLEQDFSNVIFKQDNHIRVDLYKIEDNAVHRTKTRTWADPIEFYNERPLVDRVLQEKVDEHNKKYRRLVLLLHFVVKKYEWELWFVKWAEWVIDGKRYNISELPTTQDIAANAYLVATKAVELVKSLKK